MPRHAVVFLRLTAYHCLGLTQPLSLTIWGLCFAIIAFICTSWLLPITGISGQHVFYLALGGPPPYGGLIPVLMWLLPYGLFLLTVGNVFQAEWSSNGLSIWLRAGNRMRWWAAKLISMALFSLLCIVVAAAIIWLVTWICLPKGSLETHPLLEELPWGEALPHLAQPGFLAMTGAVLLTSFFALALLQTALTIQLRNGIYAYALMLSMLLLSWLAADHFSVLLPWLPGTQSMLLRHYPFASSQPGFNLEWSLTYHLVEILVGMLWGGWLIHKGDLFPITNADLG